MKNMLLFVFLLIYLPSFFSTIIYSNQYGGIEGGPGSQLGNGKIYYLEMYMAFYQNPTIQSFKGYISSNSVSIGERGSDFCSSILLSDDDYINGYTIYYDSHYIYGLKFYTFNGYSCECIFSSSNLTITTEIYEGYALTGFNYSMGYWIDNLQFEFDSEAINSTKSPTPFPTKTPTKVPTKVPTRIPTRIPTRVPTKIPTSIPTRIPTRVPTKIPTRIPTRIPTKIPTEIPTINNPNTTSSSKITSGLNNSDQNSKLVYIYVLFGVGFAVFCCGIVIITVKLYRNSSNNIINNKKNANNSVIVVDNDNNKNNRTSKKNIYDGGDDNNNNNNNNNNKNENENETENENENENIEMGHKKGNTANFLASNIDITNLLSNTNNSNNNTENFNTHHAHTQTQTHTHTHTYTNPGFDMVIPEGNMAAIPEGNIEGNIEGNLGEKGEISVTDKLDNNYIGNM